MFVSLPQFDSSLLLSFIRSLSLAFLDSFPNFTSIIHIPRIADVCNMESRNRTVHWYTTALASLFVVAGLGAHTLMLWVPSIGTVTFDYSSVLLVTLALLYFVMDTLLGVSASHFNNILLHYSVKLSAAWHFCE